MKQIYRCMFECLQHVQLLKQFLDTNTIQIADNMKTGVCRKQQRNLVRAAEQAIEEGTSWINISLHLALGNIYTLSDYFITYSVIPCYMYLIKFFRWAKNSLL